jgi:multidrug resistance efflux pump
MLELLLCSMVTIFPDYLYRRYGQGKRIGREITFYSVWHELRYGITACLILTLTLITLIFYFHPSTSNATMLFRTISILPDRGGRVAEVYVQMNEHVTAGQPLFRLDSSEQEAAVKTAASRVAEVDAAIVVAQSELAGADGVITQAQSAYQQALDELQTKEELLAKGSGTVTEREVEKLRVALDGRQGAVASAIASKQTLETKLNTLLPAQKASAEAALAQAQTELDKTLVVAGVDGTVTQFALRPGDVVNPMLRPAGIIIPSNAGQGTLIAGFGQIEAQVMKVGMVGEIICAAKPFAVIPVVVSEVQGVIAAGQFRPTDQLVDVQQVSQPGTITVFMEALYPGDLDDIPPGASCIANAYSSYHDRLADPNLSGLQRFGYHAIDTVGLVHAMIIRIQALLMPVQTLVLTGGH